MKMKYIQIPAVVRHAFVFFDFVSLITKSEIQTCPDDVEEPVGMLGTNPPRSRIPRIPEEWESAYFAATKERDIEMLNLCMVVCERLDEGDDMCALDFIMRGLAVAMREPGEIKHRAEEIMDAIHHDIVRGASSSVVSDTAKILETLKYAKTKEERIAIRRYARAMASFEEWKIAKKLARVANE